MRMKITENNGWLPFKNTAKLAMSLFKVTESEEDQEANFVESAKLAASTFFLIGGVSSLSSISVNTYGMLMNVLWLPEWVVIGITICVSVIMLLVLDIFLGAISPFIFNFVFKKKDKSRLDKFVGLVMVTLLGCLVFTTMSLTRSGTPIAVAAILSNGKNLIVVDEVSVYSETSDNLKELIGNIDSDLAYAKKKDSLNRVAVASKYHEKLNTFRRQYRGPLSTKNDWALNKHDKLVNDSSNAIINLVQTADQVMSRKHDLIAEQQRTSASVRGNTSSKNKSVSEEYETKTETLASMVTKVGLAGTGIGLMLALIIGLYESETPKKKNSTSHTPLKNRVWGGK